MAITTLVSLSVPTANPFIGGNNTRCRWHGSTDLFRKSHPKLTTPLASSSSSSAPVPIVVDPPSSSPQEPEASEDTYKVPIGGCKGCGKEEKERGCNGEGRIQGGIATVPGFGWWPIKAYRPCPGFVASGGRYRRQGQSMDEVVSGGRGREAPVRNSSGVQSSKKKKKRSKKSK